MRSRFSETWLVFLVGCAETPSDPIRVAQSLRGTGFIEYLAFDSYGEFLG